MNPKVQGGDKGVLPTTSLTQVWEIPFLLLSSPIRKKSRVFISGLFGCLPLVEEMGAAQGGRNMLGSFCEVLRHFPRWVGQN
jgi:hypothetical protein